MPELPEVHTITTDLRKNILGYKITTVEILEGNIKLSPQVDAFAKNIVDSHITDVKRMAKNIVIELDTKDFIVIHLGMTGRLLLKDHKKPKLSWERVVFSLAKNEKEKYLKYCDMRMFGRISFVTKKQIEIIHKKYGPDIFTKKLTKEKFLKRLKSKRTNIKNALLDQKIVSGIGNIYAIDALFMAGLHPETPTKEITPQTAKVLLESLREILKEGIAHRGSTLNDKMYMDIFGKYGTHQNYFRVYGKKTCPICETKVEFKKITGRGTYFCPKCQQQHANKNTKTY